MNEEKIASALASINEQLKTIFNELEEIKRTLHGDSGLVTKVAKLEKAEEGAGKNMNVVGWIITTIIALYAAFFKHAN